jgi:hypothetical protein
VLLPKNVPWLSADMLQYNCGSESEAVDSESDESVSSELNSKNEETEEELVRDARTKRPRLQQQSNMQWENVDDSYCPSKIQFSKNSGPIKSVRSASEAFNLYSDDPIMDTIVTETNS